MSFLYRVVFLLFSVILLSSCTDKRMPAIPEDLPIAATINIKDMTVSFIDLDKKEKLADWKLDKPYTGAVIFPDGDTIFLYGKQLETADLYSLNTGKKIGSWDTGQGIVNGKLLQFHSEIALVDQNQSKIRFFDLEGNELASIKTEVNPLTILEDQKERKLYVLSFDSEELTVIDLIKKEAVLKFPIHSSAAGAWLNESSNEIWIGGHGEGMEIEKDIHVYDTKTGTFKKEISAPSMPVNFIGKDKFVYVLSHGSSMLYKLNEDGQVLESVTVGANPFELAFADEWLLAAGYDSDDLHIIEPEKLAIIKTIKVGKGPFQIILRERK